MFIDNLPDILLLRENSKIIKNNNYTLKKKVNFPNFFLKFSYKITGRI